MNPIAKDKPNPGMGLVYALSDPSNPRLPRYIGKTKTSTRQRLGNHISYSESHPEHPMSKWVGSLMDSGIWPLIYVLETCPLESLQDRETHWIRFFKPLGALTNISEGNGSLGIKGRMPSESNRQKTIERNKMGWTATMRKNWLAANTKPWSEERKRKYAESGQRDAFINRTKALNPNREISIPVVCDDGREFSSIKEASRETKISETAISRCLKGGKSCFGVIFKRKE